MKLFWKAGELLLFHFVPFCIKINITWSSKALLFIHSAGLLNPLMQMSTKYILGASRESILSLKEPFWLTQKAGKSEESGDFIYLSFLFNTSGTSQAPCGEGCISLGVSWGMEGVTLVAWWSFQHGSEATQQLWCCLWDI